VSPAELVTLAAGDSRLLVYPGIGGAIARYTWRGTDVLRPAPDEAIRDRRVRQMGCYPLVPYSNRIGHGRLAFAAQLFTLRPNFPPEPHAIHGLGWQRPWTVRSQGPATVALHLQHAPDADWPFAFEATESFELASRSLRAAIGIRNADTRAMPAGLGFHPYFPARSRARLQAEWQGVWTGAGELPTGHGPVPPQWDFRAPRPAGPWVVDHCFTGWARRAVLDYGTHRVVLTASEPLERIVCFAPGDGRDFIALEPVSHAPDAFALAAAGRSDTGMRVLAPGESFEASMAVAVEAP
jgi:aldose 1-epimerase